MVNKLAISDTLLKEIAIVYKWSPRLSNPLKFWHEIYILSKYTERIGRYLIGMLGITQWFLTYEYNLSLYYRYER